MSAVELLANGQTRILPDEADDGLDGNLVDLRKVEITPLAGPAAPPPRPHSVPVPVARVTLTEPLSAAQLTKDIRARLKVVRKEIALRKRLEREEQQLVRLLKAVKEKPPTVRPIRATG
jgi:hypothetical protein